MCWSLEVSVGVCCFELLSIAWIYRRNATPLDRAVVPVLLSVALVELGEAIIWAQGVPNYLGRDHLNPTCGPLSAANVLRKAPMLLCCYAVVSQPLLMCSCCRRMMQPPSAWRRRAFRVGEIASAAILLSKALSHGLTRYVGVCVAGVGRHGHLIWRIGRNVGVPQIAISAVYFTCFLALPMALALPRAMRALPALTTACYLFAFRVYPGGGEAYSFWCLTGVTANTFVLCTPYWRWAFGSTVSEEEAHTKKKRGRAHMKAG
jgi:hypothetical protein